MIETKKFPNRKIAILFLADKGISQPDLWRQWRSELPGGDVKILLFGIMPEDEKGWIRIDPKIPTQWCHPSLVLVEQRGLQEILKSDPLGEIQHIFFVSGDTVPLRSAKYIYNLPDEAMYWSTANRAKNYDPYKFQGATQWKAYSRRDAEKVAKFNFEDPTFKKFDQLNHFVRTPESIHNEIDDLNWVKKRFLKKIEQLSKNTINERDRQNQENRWKFVVHQVQRELDRLEKMDSKHLPPSYLTSCPDEFWIPTILKWNQGVENYMGLSKPSADMTYSIPSPVEWTDLVNERYAMQDSLPGKPAPSINLEEELRRKCDGGSLFFRKISKKLPLKGKKTWTYCTE